MSLNGSNVERASLFVPLKIDNNKNARAIYIGNITYYRDVYFRITSVVVKDEYWKERRSFIRKFGRNIKLVKALAKVVKK